MADNLSISTLTAALNYTVFANDVFRIRTIPGSDTLQLYILKTKRTYMLKRKSKKVFELVTPKCRIKANIQSNSSIVVTKELIN